ncbi:hypothetical protein PVK06_033352 [Gossypium arboreum]|uniref:Uncharacterized protein n=1 Tax=Gossypium arboreum TaxID=29729 RepID=A0ABR0NB79_GOSAR|nr:hypothetical protein PVK06_033352 [Gossypium arboreum]
MVAQKRMMEAQQETLQDVASQISLLNMVQLSEIIGDAGGLGRGSKNRGKVRVKEEIEDEFPFSPKPTYVELPLFTGKDPKDWIALAHDFFDFYEIEDHHRVTMASFRMDGLAKKWFQ